MHRFSQAFVAQFVIGLLITFAGAAQAAQLSDESLALDGRERRFLVHDYSDGSSSPLVIVLHGGGGNGANAAEQTGFDRVAEREGLIAVYPYGSGNRQDSLLSWNAAHCCVYAMQQDVDDIEFMRRLLDHLQTTRSVDENRIYVTGLSNGGMMTHRIGFELGERIAAIAPVISGVFGDEPLRELNLPVLIITGAEDQIIRPEGGMPGGIASLIPFSAERPVLPATEQAAYWAAVNDCAQRTSEETVDYHLDRYSNCRAGTEVLHYVVSGSGHSWPGGTPPRTGADLPVTHFDANDVIWDFFSRFQRSDMAAATDPWFYDNYLNLPQVAADSRTWRARLKLVAARPALQFELMRLQPTAGAVTDQLPAYRPGLLSVPFLQAGSAAYGATLIQTSVSPLRFSVQTLVRLPDL